jgi:hypothetical protein
MVKVTFELNGRKVSPNQIGSILERAAMQRVQGLIEKSVGSVRCKVHGNAPSITVKGRSIDQLNFSVSGCCEDLIKQVHEKLKS